MKTQSKELKRRKRHAKIRSKIKGVPERPRLSLFRSNKGMFVQLIDDVAGKTLASVSFKELKSKSKESKVAAAKEIGKLIAQKAQDKKVKKVVFDRGGYKYHGRVKSFAEGAREGGLEF